MKRLRGAANGSSDSSGGDGDSNAPHERQSLQTQRLDVWEESGGILHAYPGNNS
jgi:hypothetical protein